MNRGSLAAMFPADAAAPGPTSPYHHDYYAAAAGAFGRGYLGPTAADPISSTLYHPSNLYGLDPHGLNNLYGLDYYGRPLMGPDGYPTSPYHHPSSPYHHSRYPTSPYHHHPHHPHSTDIYGSGRYYGLGEHPLFGGAAGAGSFRGLDGRSISYSDLYRGSNGLFGGLTKGSSTGKYAGGGSGGGGGTKSISGGGGQQYHSQYVNDRNSSSDN